jgi:hypothetical protein
MTTTDPNPFFAWEYHGQKFYTCDADDRIKAVRSFSRAQCEVALQLAGLQKTVEQAIQRRLRRIEREARWCARMETTP